MLSNALRVGIVIIFLGLAIWAITLSRYDLVISNSELGLWLTEALVSVGPELAGIVIGVVTIDYLNERRQDEQLKEQLISQMGSRHNDVTDTAIRTLTARGWLTDGSLKGAGLFRANLEEADLRDANLQEARLGQANLQGAFLRDANLRGAHLGSANLQGAYLREANLQEAWLPQANLQGDDLGKANLQGANLGHTNLQEVNLTYANLQGAHMVGTNLRGARLGGANLQGAYLRWVNFQEAFMVGAIMPDGTKLKVHGYPEGPTYEEWLAVQVDKQAVEEINEAMTDIQEEE